jgi:hypothetical protein
MALADSVARATQQIFKSKVSLAADQIKVKLEQARQDHAAMRERLPAAALAAEMAEPGATDNLEALRGELYRSEMSIASLVLALQEAEAREQVRLSEAEQKANTARVRALAAHMGKLRVQTMAFQRAIEEANTAWLAMLDSVRRARPLLEASRNVEQINSLTPSRLSQFAKEEISRIAYLHDHPSTVKFPMPGSSRPALWSRDVVKPTLADRVASRIEALIQAEGGRGDGGASDDE